MYYHRLGQKKLKSFLKLFFLSGPTFTPSPLLVVGPLKKITFCGNPNTYLNKLHRLLDLLRLSLQICISELEANIFFLLFLSYEL